MKLQVNVSDELVGRIDKYAQMMGVSRSALCAMFIGQGVMGYDKAYEAIDLFGGKFVENLGLKTDEK